MNELQDVAGARAPLVVLAGNPNSGKSTLFNRLTGGSARTGNYPGVTVESSIGVMQVGEVSAELVDLPGTYSLVARTLEERLTLSAVLGLEGLARPDVVAVCADATVLSRSLYLLLQLQELGVPVVLILTMVDQAEGLLPEPGILESLLRCPVVRVVARDGLGLDETRQALSRAIDAGPPPPVWRWAPGEDLREAIELARVALPPTWPASDALGLWALMSWTPEGEEDAVGALTPELQQAMERLALHPSDIDDEAIGARYAWLDAEVLPLLQGQADRSFTEKLDRVLIHPVAGFAVFLVVMGLLFQGLFAWSDPAIGAIEMLFGWLGGLAEGALPAGILTDLLVEGVIGGVGGVIVFLPQILLLFLLLGLLEDSGYLARVAYLMDRIMRSMGLNGRAFVPMLSGFACAVPAIMATRSMPRERDRILTMMVVPLMTCSARLPVYTLIIGSLFVGSTWVQSGLLLAMYAFSVLTALITAWVLSKTLLKAQPTPLVLELPTYRWPRLRDVATMMWRRTKEFLKDAGTVILGCTIVLWGLLSFPANVPTTIDYPAAIAAASSEEQVQDLENALASEQLAGSYAGQVGQFIEPAIEPLGFDWKIGVGLIGAFAAREVFVSTMGVVYSVGDSVDEEDAGLRARMMEERRADGSSVYTPLTGLSLLVFFALAAQCMSTLAVVKRETGGWKWPVFMTVYMTALAWGASFVVYQGGRLLGFQ